MMSRIRARSANSLLVNQEKPKDASALPGGNGVTTSASPHQARSRSSRARKKWVAVAEQRIGDRGLLRSVPAQPHQDDDIRVFQQQQNRVAERRRAQAVPIKAGAFGTQSEFAGQFDDARSRQGIALDQVAAADSADFGIDPVLRAQPEKAGQRCLGRDGVVGPGIYRRGACGDDDGHALQPIGGKCDRDSELDPENETGG
jgi:hypothetical protein